MLLPDLKPAGIHSLDVPWRIMEEVMQLLAITPRHQRGEDRHGFVVLLSPALSHVTTSLPAES